MNKENEAFAQMVNNSKKINEAFKCERNKRKGGK